MRIANPRFEMLQSWMSALVCYPKSTVYTARFR